MSDADNNAGPSVAPAATTGTVTVRDPTPKEGLVFFHILAANTGKLEVGFLLTSSSQSNPPLDTHDDTYSLQVDWEVVATRLNYANATSAKVRYNQIKRSLITPADNDNTSTPTKTPTKAKAKAKAKKAGKGEIAPGDSDDGVLGSGTNTTPSKVKKVATPRKKKALALAFGKGKVSNNGEPSDHKTVAEAGNHKDDGSMTFDHW